MSFQLKAENHIPACKGLGQEYPNIVIERGRGLSI